jgi:Zn-finger nucleic acid-binding protein
MSGDAATGGAVDGESGAMTCPKCGAEMRTHRRNGVTIEQCRKCHGIFLDRGELEQLIGRESSFLGEGAGEGFD